MFEQEQVRQRGYDVAGEGGRKDNKGNIARKFETESTEASIRGTKVVGVECSTASLMSFINVDDLDPLAKARFIKKVVEASEVTSVSFQLFRRYVDVIVVAVKNCLEELRVVRSVLVDNCSSQAKATKFLSLGCHEALQRGDCNRDGAWPEKHGKDDKHCLSRTSACV